MHYDAVGFVFKEPAECIMLEVLAKLFKAGLSGYGGMFEFAASIGVKSLGTVEAPNLKRRFEAQEGCDFTGWSASDDGHTGAPFILNAIKRLTDADIGA